MKIDDFGEDSSANLASSVDDGDVLLANSMGVATCDLVGNHRVLDSAASMHICKDRIMFMLCRLIGFYGHNNREIS